MAKKNKILVILRSTASSFFFIKKRNPRTQEKKLSFRKYDPNVRKHVLFKEEKLK